MTAPLRLIPGGAPVAPVPCCGEEPQVKCGHRGIYGHWLIRCLSCKSWTRRSSREEAIEAWASLVRGEDPRGKGVRI